MGDWESTRQAFQAMATCELRQGWNETAESGFLPAWVSIGVRGKAEKTLWVYARIRDLDIGNAATVRNQCTWKLGDVFEVCLEPIEGEAYFEFHVTPENQVLECKFPIPRDPKAPLPLLEEPILRSWTNVSPIQWEVLAELSLDQLEVPAPREWKFSFSRYDAGPGRKPILSSSSPHSKPAFHCREEWGTLIVE